jgi:phosphatidylserine decarboxylase
MRIAPEGIPLIVTAIILSLVGWILFYFFPVITKIPALAFSLSALIFIFFFRDPERIALEGENLILAPADGRILPLDKVFSPEGGQIIIVSIFLSLLDVHINRVPVDGVVERIEYRPGRYKIASRKEASQSNKMNVINFKTAYGTIVTQQVAGALVRRVICYLKEGTQVKMGTRMGIMKFGSRMDLLLPPNVELKVKTGDRVKAGLDIIGEWKDE